MPNTFDIEGARKAGYTDQEINTYLLKNKELSVPQKIAQAVIKSPALPIAGGIAGGIAGAAAGAGIGSIPMGIAGAGLGGGAGEAYRQLAARKMGLPSPQSSMEAAKGIGIEGTKQAAAQTVGVPLGMAGRAIENVGIQALTKGARGLTKIDANNFVKIFKNPLELLTAPTKKTISTAYSKAIAKLPNQGLGTVDEAERAITGGNEFIKKAIMELRETPEKLNPKTFIDARKAVDGQITVIKNGLRGDRSLGKETLMSLQKTRVNFNKILDKIAPDYRKADALNAKGAAANSFRSLMIRPNVLHSMPRLATAPLAIPAVAGGLTALAGAASKSIPPLARTALATGASQIPMQGALDSLMQALQNNRRKKK